MTTDINTVNRIAEKYIYADSGAWNHIHGIGTPVFTNPNIPAGTMYAVNDHIHISGISDLMRGRLPDKEPPMSTLDKIIAERREARERERINFLYQAYDNANFEDLDDGTVLRLSVNDEWFAAVIDDDRWSVTGVGTPNGLPTEDFVAWLIGRDVEVADIEVIAP